MHAWPAVELPIHIGRPFVVSPREGEYWKYTFTFSFANVIVIFSNKLKENFITVSTVDSTALQPCSMKGSNPIVAFKAYLNLQSQIVLHIWTASVKDLHRLQ